MQTKIKRKTQEREIKKGKKMKKMFSPGKSIDELYNESASDSNTKTELDKESKRLDTAIALIQLREEKKVFKKDS